MQVPSSTTALSSSILSALTGHTSTQAPQPMQVSLSIFTAMIQLLKCFATKLICTLISVKHFLDAGCVPSGAQPLCLSLVWHMFSSYSLHGKRRSWGKAEVKQSPIKGFHPSVRVYPTNMIYFLLAISSSFGILSMQPCLRQGLQCLR